MPLYIYHSTGLVAARWSR